MFAIIGQGLVGLLLAESILKTLPSIKIVLIDKASVKTENGDKYSSRSVALSRKNVDFITDVVGPAQSKFFLSFSQTVSEMRVWSSDSSEKSHVSFKCEVSKKKDDHLAHVFNLSLLESFFKERLLKKKRRNLQVLNNVRINSINTTEQGITINFNENSRLKCDMIFGCDGMHSYVRKLRGFKYTGEKYNQVALCCLVEVEGKNNSGIAYQKFIIGHGPQ